VKIQEYLRDNGYPEHVVLAGKAGLVRQWRDLVERAEKGYSLGLEDYRNDLDARGILRVADAEDEEIAALDERLRKLLTGEARVWESAPGDPFWDFGYPRNAGTELMNGLREDGLL
jgi:hypothetical protein